MGDGSPGLREAEGEGGEGFYIAQSGRRADLHVIWGGKESQEIACSKSSSLAQEHKKSLKRRGSRGKDSIFCRLFTRPHGVIHRCIFNRLKRKI